MDKPEENAYASFYKPIHLIRPSATFVFYQTVGQGFSLASPHERACGREQP